MGNCYHGIGLTNVLSKYSLELLDQVRNILVVGSVYHQCIYRRFSLSMVCVRSESDETGASLKPTC